jgi:hypothetical protein
VAQVEDVTSPAGGLPEDSMGSVANFGTIGQ